MGNGINSRMPQFGGKRRITFRWKEVMEAVLRTADLFKEFLSCQHETRTECDRIIQPAKKSRKAFVSFSRNFRPLHFLIQRQLDGCCSFLEATSARRDAAKLGAPVECGRVEVVGPALGNHTAPRGNLNGGPRPHATRKFILAAALRG